MNAPLDDAARRRALDPETSFVVQAPAGSGKTELLTRRILTLLARVEEPEQVLAITFTRKAAAEMRQRVMEQLRAADSGTVPDDPYAAEGVALAQRVLEADARFGWQLIDDPQRLALGTIDSLATRLAHRLPLVSTLGAPTAVTEDARSLHLEAAGRFIETRLDRLDLVLLQTGNRFDRLQALLADLLGTRDQWMRLVVPYQDQAVALRAGLEVMLERLVAKRLADLQALCPPGYASGLPPIIADAVRYLVAQGDASGEPLAAKPAALLASLRLIETMPGAALTDLPHWQALAALLLTEADEPRRQVNKNQGFPAKTSATALGVNPALLVAHKAAMVDVLESLAGTSQFADALAGVRSLPAPRYTDEDWALLEQLVGTLPELLAELYVLFGERASVDFTEIAQRAVTALGDEDNPTNLALSMDLKIRHVLVDEFQDTSRAQWALFEKLVMEWEPDDGRTFFIVGDPMQSIYRFREGDVALFHKARDRGIGPVRFEALRLEVNFRSQPSVINWVNAVFLHLFPDVADPNIGEVTFEASSARREGQGSVQVRPLPNASTDQEAETIASLVSDALAMDAAHTVGILVRSRAAARPVVAALQAIRIPFCAVEMDLLSERPVVRDLVALTLALRSPHDRLNWLALLRGPLCGLLLADLHALIKDAPRAALIESLRDPERVAGLTDDGQRRVARFVSVIGPAVDRAPRATLVPWVEAVWLQLGGPAACRDESDFDAAERCLATLVELEKDGRIWRRGDIVSALDKLYAVGATDAESARVQIMTVHKSKGLEFDTVVLPALGRRPAIDSSGLINWYDGTLDGEQNLLFAPIDPPNAGSDQKSGIVKLVRRLREQAEAAERLRLLYVACTRARSHLHLVTPLPLGDDRSPKKPHEASFLHPLFELVCEEYECQLEDQDGYGADEFDVAVDSDAASVELPDSVPEVTKGGVTRVTTEGATPDFEIAPEPPLFRRTLTDWVLPDFDRFNWQTPRPEPEAGEQIAYDWSSDAARDIGTVVHGALRALSVQPAAERTPPDDEVRERLMRELKNLGVNDVVMDEAIELVLRSIRNTLEDPKGQWILDDSHAEGRSEWALSVPEFDAHRHYLGTRRIIIDRTFVTADGTRWIVDYKTGTHEGSGLEDFLDREVERYREQLETYAGVMHRIDKRPVRVGLWFPMLREWREFTPTPARQLKA